MKFSEFKIWDLLFPKRCVVCDRALTKNEEGVCEECRPKIKYISKNGCRICGLPVKPYEEICCECKERPHVFTAGKPTLSYDFIGDSVYRFKYTNRPEYAGFYADCMVNSWREWLEAIEADAIVPVPLHKKRLSKRGYNQAEELAREISKRTGIPLRADLCVRARNTRPQKYFDLRDRQINVKKAFIVNGNGVKLKTIVVVDDIFTTGSTIDSLSAALLEAGVKRVYYMTITAAGT